MDNKEFTLEDILAEQRAKRQAQAAQENGTPRTAGAPSPQQGRPQSAPQSQEPAPQTVPAQQKPAPKQETPATPAPEARQPEASQEGEDQADLNAYATGTLELPRVKTVQDQEEASWEEPEERSSEKKKKKKKKWGLFGRKKRTPDYNENEDDMYYGIQLKPIDEYRMGYDSAGELTSEAETYKTLFDDSKKAIDNEVEANFQRLQRERRRRVAEAVQTAGVDEEQIADEFGVVAPMPVTSFAADPYARQHGIGVEGNKRIQEDMPEIQKAMLETSNDQTMEIKLNVLNDTVELQRVQETQPVSEEAVNRVLASPGPMDSQEPEQPTAPERKAGEAPAVPQAHAEDSAQETTVFQPPVSAGASQATGRISRQEAPAGEERSRKNAVAEEDQATRAIPMPRHAAQERPRQETRPGQEAQADQEATTVAPAVRPTQRQRMEPPQLGSIYEYRSRNVPTHIIHAEVLQSALLSESEELRQESQSRDRRRTPKRRVRNKKLENPAPKETPIPDSDTKESIDDYTGPEDIKSISHELRGEMRELTLRMMITGVCTLLLAIVNLIFRGQFTGTGDMGSLPVVYVVLTLVFLAVAAGICYKTILNGLKALFAFNANSDSAAAVATVAVAIQAVASAFFQDDLTDGNLHLYAVVLSAILFLNAAGKLTMIRRIHSNFRFITSREQKYSVRTYDDYNTALKMAKDCVAERPVIAYQCKAGFLKRFLELSYNPDPSESASRLLAPIGLIASLVLTIATLLLTNSVPTAISAFAAASCACVAVSNMLSVNLPISRLCRTARRAGAMVVGYEAVEQLGNVNAVMVDAEELFPRGTVVLNGIKTYGDRGAAEDGVMAASALVKEVGGPLSGVFDQVISENEDVLPQVETHSYEDNQGIVGQVDGKTICIGNRALLINHRIQVPAREEEAQYASGGQQVIYLAVDTSVVAMLVLTYTADRRRKNEIQRLEDSGISVIVRTTDPNVTSQLISRLFGVDTASVGILDSRLGQEYQKLTGTQIPRADAVVATKGRMESMMNVISACVEERRTIGMVVALQNAAVVLGFVLVAFLACFGAMGQLSSLILFLFQLFWLLVVILLPRLRK